MVEITNLFLECAGHLNSHIQLNLVDCISSLVWVGLEDQRKALLQVHKHCDKSICTVVVQRYLRAGNLPSKEIRNIFMNNVY